MIQRWSEFERVKVGLAGFGCVWLCLVVFGCVWLCLILNSFIWVSSNLWNERIFIKIFDTSMITMFAY